MKLDKMVDACRTDTLVVLNSRLLVPKWSSGPLRSLSQILPVGLLAGTYPSPYDGTVVGRTDVARMPQEAVGEESERAWPSGSNGDDGAVWIGVWHGGVGEDEEGEEGDGCTSGGLIIFRSLEVWFWFGGWWCVSDCR